MKYIIAKIIEFAAICAAAIILIKMGYGGAFACEKDKEELE